MSGNDNAKLTGWPDWQFRSCEITFLSMSCVRVRSELECSAKLDKEEAKWQYDAAKPTDFMGGRAE
jgi:hypothetical protein